MAESPLERLFALENFGIKLGLENIARLCEALGHPERSFASIHVAGTNGKGSVTAMTHAALAAAGHRAARYTSPHLSDITERFVIGDRPVAHDAFEAAADDVLTCADGLREDGTLSVSPTFFEATTAIAFELFRRASVDVAVIEVGMGGRFDATNVITPVAGAITTIGFDHQQHLGHTLEAIAFEKAGIIKAGATFVAGALVPEAMAVTERVARDRGADLVRAFDGVRLDTSVHDGVARLTMTTREATYGPLALSLRGEHQIDNAVVVVRLLEVARARGIHVTREAIEAGLMRAHWPARLELLTLRDGRQVLIDAAHNAEGAAALAAHLRRWYPQRVPLVLGVMRDKDLPAIVKVLAPVVASITATAVATPRALPAAQLAERVQSLTAHLDLPSPLAVTTVDDAMTAIDRALAASNVICVAGSIFLAGAVREQLVARATLG